MHTASVTTVWTIPWEITLASLLVIHSQIVINLLVFIEKLFESVYYYWTVLAFSAVLFIYLLVLAFINNSIL